MRTYTTKTEPPLTLRCFQEKGAEKPRHVVTFGSDAEPELMKVLYLGDDEREALAEFEHVKKHYEAREKDAMAEFRRRKLIKIPEDDRQTGLALLRKASS